MTAFASPSRALTLGLLGLLLLSSPTRAEGPSTSPFSPADEHAKFRLADPGLRIELVVAEPDVISPVAAAWDEDGRMYVAEMIDYPSGPTAGRIKRLEDRDGDGKYERVSVFAEGLPYPSGVLPWRGGVLVTAAPNLWYFRDADGDGRAEERRVILTGFGEGNTQLRVNGLTWGRDNWVYGANGRSDGTIRRPDDAPDKAIPLRFHDFRFKPETGELEPVAGFSQFGLPRDDRGDRFPSWNTIPIRHVVLEERTLSRNPYLAESSTVAPILDPADGGRVYSISPAPATFNREPVAYFNASCGPTIYRGDALGADYRGNAFVCESLTNLVHRRVLAESGPTYVARRVEKEKEFLASTDSAFRPVNLATGPDGALYVIDFYREMVEHPQFVPEDVRQKVEFRRWNNRGRIWRILPKSEAGPKVASPSPSLGKSSTAELVAHLGRPNGWWRDTAQRLLVERRDRGAVPALVEAAAGSKEPLGRLHALWTLDGLEGLDDAVLAKALRDADPIVREGAARLSLGRTALARELATLADDPEVRVRFQAAIALGGVNDDLAPAALARIAAREVGDDWMRLAVLSGLRDSAWKFLSALLASHPEWLTNPSPEGARLLAQTAAILGARNQAEELRALADVLKPGPADQSDAGRIALLSGLAEGLARSGEPLPNRLAGGPSAWGESSRKSIEGLLDRAKAIALSSGGNAQAREQALRVLARCRPPAAAELIPGLLGATQPQPVQSAAARAVSDVGSAELATQALNQWGELTIATRRELLAAVLGSVALTASLVDALEQDRIALTELDVATRDVLRRIPEPALRDRALALLAKSAPPDRADVLKAFQPALTLSGDPKRGAEHFVKNCQTCHQRQGQGNRVGPDLSGVGGRPASALLSDILDPNKNVSPDFVSFLVVTKRGQVLSGLLIEETPSSLKLRRAEGNDETVLRSEVEEFRSTGRSLMPEGLEQTLGVQGVADLLSFLRQP